MIDVPFLAEAPAELPAGRSPLFIIGAGLIALVLSLIVWPAVRFIITIAHEGSHAMTAAVMGATVHRIEVYRSRPGQPTGATFFSNAGPFGRFFTLMAGYLGPSGFGLVGALMLAGGHAVAVLWLSVIFLFLALINAGNFVGRIAMIIVGFVIVMMIRSTSVTHQTFFAYAWIWFLLFGGFGQVIALQVGRRDGKDAGSDAFQLRKMTFLPASLWSGFFWLLTLAALIYGASILLGLVHIGS